ncbi:MULTISPECIES: outer membrane protein assembly factor BamB family protein [unclassified Sphingomonas]|uniref:outer membrane protein assembly factor BamB family protein n=1 Tax=unclassified Sphingomonas TaxID=196159 RepID=UPI000701892A|nr:MULTISPECIES: PQQ-binding-like beta-propeller repeat protein [unclassified Sphingomonas]KQM60097.1 hypothetical protein ASE65_10355 [Sphingomonas sp. Leaf16]KQN11495.1 hypothetical protein ASE81_11340 [Sphingomonas sp. Leaf29]KQN18817.1 hypothetical protein ASE83_11280 [Sphingomonas sp. Leaf32]
MIRKTGALVGAGLLASCGGGNGSGAGTIIGPPAPPTLAITLAPSATTQTITDTGSTSFSVDATYTGTTSDPVVPELTFDTSLLTLDGTPTLTGNRYSARFKTVAGLSGMRTATSNVRLRLCKETPCVTAYPGSDQSFTYMLNIELADWTMLQRNAGHTGYVNATFEAAATQPAWTWSSGGTSFTQPVAARKGQIFATRSNADGSKSVHAINSATGAEVWSYYIGNIYSAGGPTLVGDQLALASMSMSSGDNPLIVLNATTGRYVRDMRFASQWSNFAQLAAIGDNVYLASGYYGNVVYGFDTTTGAAKWQAAGSAGHVWDGATPAADERYVYYYSGALDVFDRATGAKAMSIPDPFWQWNGYSYRGGPMLGSAGHVIAYSGSGGGTYALSLPLVDYDTVGAKVRWRSAGLYSTIPAVARGVVYAGSTTLNRLDAISEEDGTVRWSWTPPAGESFIGNVIVTNGCVFLSTDRSIYAVNLNGTHETLWKGGRGGMIAITPDAKLVVTSDYMSTGVYGVTAYTLK